MRVVSSASRISANTRAEIGSRGFDLRSCRAYPKYGMTAVISCAEAPRAASIAKKRRSQFSAGGCVDCMRKTFFPRRFSSNCMRCSPSEKTLCIILPMGTLRRSHTFSAKGSLEPRLNILYPLPLDIAGSIPPHQLRRSWCGGKHREIHVYHYHPVHLTILCWLY